MGLIGLKDKCTSGFAGLWKLCKTYEAAHILLTNEITKAIFNQRLLVNCNDQQRAPIPLRDGTVYISRGSLKAITVWEAAYPETGDT